MELEIEESSYLLSFYGDFSMISSFDILSVCSDVFIDDLEGIGLVLGKQIGDGDCDGEGVMSECSFLFREIKKKDLFLEGMLMIVVVVVKKFIVER